MTAVMTSPLLRLTLLYLRSRLAGGALLACLGTALFGWYLLDQSSDMNLTKLLLATVSLGAATAVGVSARSPFGDTERVVSRPLPPLRLVHLAGLIALAALALGLANRVETVDWTEWMLVRNFAGYVGLALITARLIGASLSWITPVAYGMAAFMSMSERRWAWPMKPGDDQWAAWTVVILLVVGLGLIVLTGGRDRIEETT